MNRCLVCFHDLEEDEGILYHNHCSIKLFRGKKILQVDFGMNEIKNIATKAVATQTNVTGVQAKISLKPNREGIGKLAVVVKGLYILKPPSEIYPEMPEVEALTMQMADEFGIAVVPHGLIKMNDGTLAYITRRVDRLNNTKVHQEDLCQLSERLTEDKYKSSCERVGKIICNYAGFKKVAAIDYFNLVVFNYIHGNNDMHMKNYSMTHSTYGMHLTDAYDLLNVRLINPEDEEESALTLNGKKSNLNKRDFNALAKSLELTSEQINNVHNHLIKTKWKFENAIIRSFLSEELKKGYFDILNGNYRIFFS